MDSNITVVTFKGITVCLSTTYTVRNMAAQSCTVADVKNDKTVGINPFQY